MLSSFFLFSYFVGTKYEKCFLRVRDTDDANHITIYSYVSELYSKAWNEAVSRRCFDTEFIVLHPLLTSEISINNILNNENVVKIFTPNASDAEWSVAVPTSTQIIDTATYMKSLEGGLAQNDDVKFLDSYKEVLEGTPLFRNVAVGGSFDQLHNGHRKLLSFAAAICTDRLTVGLTGDSMLKSKSHQELIDSFEDRFECVRSFLSFIKPSIQLNIVEINDPFGPAITDSTLEAIVVSSETITGGFKINQIRKEKEMNPLKVFVLNRGDSAILSSTFLREQKYLATIGTNLQI